MCLVKKLKGDGSFHVYMVERSGAWIGGGIDFTSLQDAQSYRRSNINYHQYAITWRRKGLLGWLVVERNR